MDIGAVINGQYSVIEHIGRGGMADVWSARDTRLRRMVAIKTIAAGLGSELDPVTLFKREAHTIAQMEHPHILPIYDFGEYDNSLYIVMRYMTSGSLEDLLRSGPLAPEDVLRLGEAVGQALDYAHSNNVIHLDLKPPNILLDSSKSPYLADFGLATALDPEGRANNPGSGTLLYMAPEQMIAETLDHRADIYSFCIMLFHMFTGRLPFDGTAPLAMQQVQRGEEMPYVDDYVSHLPSDLTTVLRVGTAQDPLLRPETHMDIMQQVREILQPSGISIMAGEMDFEGEIDSYNLPTEPYEGISDSDLLEAVDIYSRARYNWQGGQGRFLLGVTHFMLMSEYYENAHLHGLSIDQHGYQMLLRGALEYDHELNYWWSKVNNDDRRWVCLHALRSGNAPARIRALYRLETLPDEEGTGVIPRLVAQALEIETDETAKIAALTVLGTRARLMKPRPKMQIMTQYRGRLITTMTRLGIEMTAGGEWQEVIYSKDVDLLVAEEAFDPNPHIADFAARTIGKMRSLTAITHLANQQVAGRVGSLRALALVRDEAPSLPDVVNPEARFYAWITNTIRRLSENPLESFLRFAFVFLAGAIGMGAYIYAFYRMPLVGTFLNARWSNTLGMGITFGVLLGLTYLFSSEISRRLQRFWPWWMRLLVAGLLGYITATISYASYRFLFMQDPIVSIAWDEMRLAGAALAFGLVGAQLLNLKAWQSVLFTLAVAFVPIHHTFYAYYFADSFTILPTVAYMLAIGVFCGWRTAQLVQPVSEEKPKNPVTSYRNLLWILAAGGLGIIWTLTVWIYARSVYPLVLTGEGFPWDVLLWLSALSIAFGAFFSYWLKQYRYLFLVIALVSFGGIYALVSWQFFDYSFVLPLSQPSFVVDYYLGTPLRPITEQPIIYFEDAWDIGNVILPMFLVMVLGLNFREVLSDWLNWIGKPRTPKERGAWLNMSLSYVMIITALISLLALFASGQNRLWELAWSGMAFISFVCALATFRWAKWGAQGLLLSGMLMVVGAFVYDALISYYHASNGLWPAFLTVIPVQIPIINTTIEAPQIFFWAMWSIVLAVFAWGALRRALWGGIGLVVMLLAWFVVSIFSPVMGSMAVFALTNLALVAYALSSKYEHMETGRWPMGNRPAVVAVGNDTVPLTLETQIFSPDAKPAPATELVISEDVLPKKPVEMLTEIDPMGIPAQLDTVQFEQKPDLDMDTAPQIKLDTEALRTQLTPVQPPKLSIDTSALKSTPPANPEPPKFKLDFGDIRNQRTVRFNEDKPKPETPESDTPEA